MSQRLFVFEFVDALFPTSFFEDKKYFELGLGDLPIDVGWYLPRLGHEIAKLLETISEHGKVCIITKAPEEKVKKCCQSFTPSLWDSIVRLRIPFAGINPNDGLDVDKWLSHAFLISVLDAGQPSNQDFNLTLVSIGGNESELEVSRRMKQVLPHCAVKLVRLQEKPTPQQLSDLLKKLSETLKSIKDDSVDEEMYLEINAMKSS